MQLAHPLKFSELPVLHFFLLFIIYAAFISLGLPDGVLGVAWPAMRHSLEQPLASVGLITLVLTVCSAASGFFSGRVIARLGTGLVVMLSGLMTGLALLVACTAPPRQPAADGWHEVTLPGKASTQYDIGRHQGREAVMARSERSASMWRRRLAVPASDVRDVSFSWWVHAQPQNASVADVDSGVKNAALKKLFADPHYNVMDGLDIYIGDYNTPDPLPKSMLRQMVQSRLLGLFDDEPEAPAAPTPPASAAAPAPPAKTLPDEDPDLRLQPDDAAGRAEPRAGAGEDERREP